MYNAMYSPKYPALGACPKAERKRVLAHVLSAHWAEMVVGFEPYYGGCSITRVELCNGRVVELYLSGNGNVSEEWY